MNPPPLISIEDKRDSLTYLSYQYTTSRIQSPSQPCTGWAKRCLVMASSTLEINQHNTEEVLHPLQALGYFICSQAMSTSTLDYGKNDKRVKLLYSNAHANLEQLSGEEVEKLEAISNICNSSRIQLQKIKRCLEKGDEASKEKALSYVDDTLEFLRRQKRNTAKLLKQRLLSAMHVGVMTCANLWMLMTFHPSNIDLQRL